MSRCGNKAREACVGAKRSHMLIHPTWLALLRGTPRARAARATLLALAGLGLAGCNDIHTSYGTDIGRTYLERRETVSFGAGDAVAANKVLQMQDPWPVASADRNLTTHGHVAAGAIERYRTGRVTIPVGMRTSSAGYQQQQQQQQNAASTLSAVPGTASAAAKP